MKSICLFFLCCMLLSIPTVGTTKSTVVLKVAVPADPETVDPYMQLSSGVLAVAHLLYDPLLRWTQDRKLEGMLATSWEQINPTTYIVKLRKGVQFHSGNPFTADDVVWTIKRLKSSLDFRGLFSLVSAEKVDAYTVKLTTSKPYPLTTNILEFVFPMDSKFYTGKTSAGVDKGIISKVSGSYADSHVSGTGPYLLEDRQPGRRLTFKKNPKYWGVQSAVDELQMIPIKEEGTRVAALLRGDVDIITPVPIQDYATLKRNPAIQLYSLTTDRVLLFTLNSGKGHPLSNKKVREAIAYGTNIKGIADKILLGQTKPVQQMALDYMDGYDSSLKARYDVKKAKKLLAEAGYTASNPLKLTMIATNDRYVKDEDFSKAFVFMMARIGVQVSLKTFPKTQYWAQYEADTADISLIGWSTDTKDSLNYGEYLLMTKDVKNGFGMYNAGQYSNTEYDALLVQARTELDKKKRNELLRKADVLAYNDVAFLPLFLEPISWAARKRVKNLGKLINPENFIPYNELIVE